MLQYKWILLLPSSYQMETESWLWDLLAVRGIVLHWVSHVLHSKQNKIFIVSFLRLLITTFFPWPFNMFFQNLTDLSISTPCLAHYWKYLQRSPQSKEQAFLGSPFYLLFFVIITASVCIPENIKHTGDVCWFWSTPLLVVNQILCFQCSLPWMLY